MNYNSLKSDIAAVVRENGNQEITGKNLQGVLSEMIDNSVGTGYLYKGIATPETQGGTPDQNVFYLAGAGTYANFSVVIPIGYIGIFRYNGEWITERISINDPNVVKTTEQSLSDEQKTQARSNIGLGDGTIDEIPTEDSDNVVVSGGVYSFSQDRAFYDVEKITQTDSEDIIIESGGQNIYFPFGMLKGTKYHIHIETNTPNTGFVRVYGVQTVTPFTSIQLHQGNIWEDISTHPIDLDYIPTEDFSTILFYVRGVAATGTATITITFQTQTAKENYVKVSEGKNLCNPLEIMPYGSIEVQESSRYGSIAQGLSTSSSLSKVALTGFIPIKNGETLCCNSTTFAVGYSYAALFKHKYDTYCILDTLQQTPIATGYQTITNNTGEDAYAVFCVDMEKANNKLIQVERSSTPTQFEYYDPIAGYKPTPKDYAAFGEIGINYPNELDIITETLDQNKSRARVRFLHVSDSHGSNIGLADTLVDNIGANFLVHTGDMVADKFNDDYSVLLSKFLAVTKPTFVTLGNHDCYQSSTVAQRFDKYIAPLNTHNGLTNNTKTYYSVDYSTEKVKCIFLDMCDAIEGASLNMSYYIRDSKMSQTQINWFISELQNALTNNYAVVCYIHVSPDYVNPITEKNWFDLQIEKAEGVAFLCDIVDAFIDATSFSVEHNGNTYTGSFSSKGMFCGWMCGHVHRDACGFMENHPKQYAINIARPYRNTDHYDGTQRTLSLGITLNYVTIDSYDRKVSVYRVGNQMTWQGVTRDSFYYNF